ncbi:MAG: iron-containing alcohol dehydrogenase [Treponema sp.]|nr:iron-containing alcohol dehydrogenase [Candidatus Treponema caballi]
MADFSLKISPNITLGSYSSTRLGQFVREWGTRYMLIMDPVLNESGAAEKIKVSLTDRNIDYFTFEELPSSPDSSILERAINLARDAHIHGVITAGGEKAGNLGRAVAALYHEANNLYEYVDGATPTTSPLPCICLPTTIKDEFLFSDRIPVIDGRTRQLKLMKSPSGLVKLALFDPNLTVSLTENQTASLAIQTLCMAVECYLSQKSNFFSDTICEKAIELLSSGMDGSPTLSNATPPEQFLMQGGCMTSLAAGISSVGPASLLALTIGARYRLPRSTIASILFPYVIEDAARFKTERLANVARIMQVASDTTSSETAATALADNIRNRLAMANLPARLKDLNISIEQLSLAAEDAGQLEMINAMPRSMTADDLFDFIKQAY